MMRIDSRVSGTLTFLPLFLARPQDNAEQSLPLYSSCPLFISDSGLERVQSDMRGKAEDARYVLAVYRYNARFHSGLL